MATNPLQPVYSRVDEYNLFQNLMTTLGNATFFGSGIPSKSPNTILVDTDLYKWFVDYTTGNIYNYSNGGWVSSGKLNVGAGANNAPDVLQTINYNPATGVLTLSNGGGSATISPPLQGPPGIQGLPGTPGASIKGDPGQAGAAGLPGTRFTVVSVIPTTAVGALGDLTLYLNASDTLNNGNIYQNIAGVNTKMGNLQGPAGLGTTGPGPGTLTINNPSNFNLSGLQVQYLGTGGSLLGTQALPSSGNYIYTYPTGTINVTYLLASTNLQTNAQITTSLKGLQNLTKSPLSFYTIGGALTDTITLFNYNTVPISTPGAAQSLQFPTNSVTLSGTGTATVTGGSIVSYLWSQLSGPNTAFTPSYITQNLVLSKLTVGTYVFKLTVTDNFGESASNTVSVTQRNAAGGQTATASQTVTIIPAQGGPVTAVTTPTQALVPGSTTGNLVGTSSVNPATSSPIAVTTWSQVSGPTTATIASAHNLSTFASGLTAGTYVFQLFAQDIQGNTTIRQSTIAISAAATAPVVNAGSNQTLALNVLACNLTGTVSESDGSTITGQTWSIFSAPAGSTAIITQTGTLNSYVTGMIAGAYVFKLTAVSSNGLTGSSNTTVTVSQSAAPTVSAGATQNLSAGTTTATLQGTATATTGATITTTNWVLTSGPAATIVSSGNLTTAINNLVTGNYVFTLTATDSNGIYASSAVTIAVAAAAGVGYTMNMNFNTTAQNIAGWVDVTAPTGPDYALVSKVIGNGVTISSVALANWPHYGTADAYNAVYSGSSTAVPVAVGNSGWYYQTAGTYTKTKAAAQLLLTGLVVGATYTLQTYNTIDNSLAPTNNFSVSFNGGTDQVVNSTANSSTLLSFTGVIPDSTGAIWLSMGSTTNGKIPVINALILSRTA